MLEAVNQRTLKLAAIDCTRQSRHKATILEHPISFIVIRYVSRSGHTDCIAWDRIAVVVQLRRCNTTTSHILIQRLLNGVSDDLNSGISVRDFPRAIGRAYDSADHADLDRLDQLISEPDYVDPFIPRNLAA